MITVTVTKTHGAATVRARVSAPTIERAVELAGPGARVEFPIDGELFFARTTREGIDFEPMSLDELEVAFEACLPGAYEPYLGALRNDMDPDAFEAYALENCLV